MKKILLICGMTTGFAFANININDASRYELMSIGGLDAGRADMVINYRENREISSINELSNIIGFGDYNISKLRDNFDFKAIKSNSKDEANQPVKIMKATRVINNNDDVVQKSISNFGNVQIIETDWNSHRRHRHNGYYNNGYYYNNYDYYNRRRKQREDYDDWKREQRQRYQEWKQRGGEYDPDWKKARDFNRWKKEQEYRYRRYKRNEMRDNYYRRGYGFNGYYNYNYGY